ncbi:MAG: hypothetical protein QG549_190 [Patescibacteria group bacterium]|nr:hypothetical protein [Patescibacteria group bacterium]
MNILESIQELRRYTARCIDDLAQRNPDFAGLNSIVSSRFGLMDEHADVFTDETAESLIIIANDISSYPGENFDKKLVQDCFDIAVELLNIALSTTGNVADVIATAKYLHPLFSQDDATIGIGWDLEEYADWYFADDVSTADKERYRNELIEDWKSVVLSRLNQA